MINRTALSTAILTDETAQRIIDYVSQIYGRSYVGLWLFEVIGEALTSVRGVADELRTETNPITANLLLDYWETHYNIPADNTLTIKQRQARLESKLLSRGPCNPYRLATAISSALGGVEVEITENIAKNTFLVNIRSAVDDISPAVAVIERKKPAHLIYQIRVATKTVAEADIKVAIAMTRAESYKVEVQ